MFTPTPSRRDPLPGAAGLAAVTPKHRRRVPCMCSTCEWWRSHRSLLMGKPRHCNANGTEPCTHTHAEASHV